MTVVNVVAGVLMRKTPDGKHTDFLLAQRPPDKVYAGYWEFPGGKVESGESHFAALVRELDEELGIKIQQAFPWLSLQYAYPHATVCLRFFHIHHWQGNIRPLEHTALTWTTIGKPPLVSPVLPANGPILRALHLPEIYAKTDARANGVKTELERLRDAFEHGLRLIQIDDSELAVADRRHFAKQVMRLAKEYHGVLVLVRDDEHLAQDIQADGLHLSAASLLTTKQRPPFTWVAASCHDAQELAKAVSLDLDFAVLDLTLPTQKATNATGWHLFSILVEKSPIPLFAMSESSGKDLLSARLHGAHGIALNNCLPPG